MLSLLTCSYVDNIIARRQDYDLTLIGLCTDGDLIGLKQLLQANPSIDISVYNESPFRNACASGNLHVCQWLLQVKPDINISAYNEQAFCWAYANHQLHVCRWLQSLKPYLYMIEYDKNGHHKSYKIRDKKEVNWEKRKYLVWLASNHCPEENKSNLLYKLPTDVSRLIIEFV